VQSQQQPESEEEYDEEWTDDEYDAKTEEDENELVEYATRPPTAVETDGGSAVDEHPIQDNEDVQKEHVEGEEEHDVDSAINNASQHPSEVLQPPDKEVGGAEAPPGMGMSRAK
jgi:hypothetical protein